MKLIIQIPCYNEENALPVTLKDLPRQVEGFDAVEWLLIDDGSKDRSIEVAKRHGVDHIVKFNQNKGLSEAFLRGLDACVKLGADVIVNTDADNQYNAADIPKLVQPILSGDAEIVIGARPIAEIEHFSPIKKMLQKLGSWAVRRLSYTRVPDAPSGFRAISKEAALKLNVFNSYTYTLETIIQAGNKNIVTTSVPIRVNGNLRPSKLVKSISAYVSNSIVTILRIFIVYRPFKSFMNIGLILFGIGLAIGLRFVYFYLQGNGTGHVQSVVLAGVLLGFGFQTIITAFLADLLAVNRRLEEDIQQRVKQQEARERDARMFDRIAARVRDSFGAENLRDSATGLYSRRFADRLLEEETRRLENRNAPVSLALLHVNNLSAVAEAHGNEAAALALQTISRMIRGGIRHEDIACRYEEHLFLLIFPNMPGRVGQTRARALKDQLERADISVQGARMPLSLACGVGSLPENGPDVWDALKAAQRALSAD